MLTSLNCRLCVFVCWLTIKCAYKSMLSGAVRMYLTFFSFFCLLGSAGQVSKSSPKKPRSRNIFKALFCCLRAQDVPQSPPPSQDTLLPPEDNGTIAKVTPRHFSVCPGSVTSRRAIFTQFIPSGMQVKCEQPRKYHQRWHPHHWNAQWHLEFHLIVNRVCH